MDTIFALSTPPGGAIAVIRVSGPHAGQAAMSLTGRALIEMPRLMTRAYLSYDGETLDDAMAVFFRGPSSYTGEDMLELYCHGSQAVIRAVCSTLSKLGLRPAEAGELTKRAFLNGKVDLTQAEAVMDLIQSEAALSARAALEQMRGRLRREVDDVETFLYEALSSVNASIDYPEELEEDVFAELPNTLLEAEKVLTRLIDVGMRGRTLRDGFRVVLLGAPNAGKSSLYNALLGYERAIVTPEAGTTRDLLEETLLIDGIPVRMLDTAGLREAESDAERQGVQRARDAMTRADAALLLLDGTCALPAEMEATGQDSTLLIRSKIDLPKMWDWTDVRSNLPQLDVSVKTGEGLQQLIEWIKSKIGSVGDAYVTNERHIQALKSALLSVKQAQTAPDADTKATDLRDALTALGSITGRAVDDEVINLIFSRFCVGK